MVFLDESGFLQVPNLQRTWARKGHTPTLVVAGRWSKISAISAISVSPKRRRLGLYTRFYPDQNIRAADATAFLHQLARHLQGPLVLLWDSSPVHKARPLRQFLQRHPRIAAYHFPGYAPELNPDEFVWTQLKRALANCVPTDLAHLRRLLDRPLGRLRRSQRLLWSCIHASELPWP